MPYADKEKQKQFQNEWLKKRHLSWLAVNGPCKECGSDENLEVHHIDPTQKVTHRVWSWTKEKQEAELAKCVVLCHACHNKTKTKEYRREIEKVHFKILLSIT